MGIIKREQQLAMMGDSLLLEANGPYTTGTNAKGERKVVTFTLCKVMEALGGFVRVNRKQAVKVSSVAMVVGMEVFLIHGGVLKMSRRRVDSVVNDLKFI